MTLRLIDILLQSSFYNMVVEGLTGCETLVQHCIIHMDTMHSTRLLLEKDTISYLSLIPQVISSSKSEYKDLSVYLREAHYEVSCLLAESN